MTEYSDTRLVGSGRCGLRREEWKRGLEVA